MKRKRKYKRLMWWRKWMKEAHRLQLRDHLYDHIADVPQVKNVKMCTGGWDRDSIEIELKDGITEICATSRFVKDALKSASFNLYIIQTQNIIHDR